MAPSSVEKKKKEQNSALRGPVNDNKQENSCCSRYSADSFEMHEKCGALEEIEDEVEYPQKRQRRN